MSGPVDARTVRHGAERSARARTDLPGGRRDAADRAVAAGSSRDQPGHARRRAAASAAQPARTPGAQERLPVHPSAARVHRRPRLAEALVSAPPFLDRYRARFDDDVERHAPIEHVRFVVLDSETTGLNPRDRSPHHDRRRRSPGRRDRARRLLRRAAQGRREHDGSDGARHHARREPGRRGGARGARSSFSNISATA